MVKFTHFLLWPNSFNNGLGSRIVNASRSHIVRLLWTSDQLVAAAHNKHKRRTSMRSAGFEPRDPKTRSAADLRFKPLGLRDQQFVHYLSVLLSPWFCDHLLFTNLQFAYSPSSRMWWSLKLFSEVETIWRFLEIRFKFNISLREFQENDPLPSLRPTPSAHAASNSALVKMYSRQLVASTHFIHSSAVLTKSLARLFPRQCLLLQASVNDPLMNTL